MFDLAFTLNFGAGSPDARTLQCIGNKSLTIARQRLSAFVIFNKRQNQVSTERKGPSRSRSNHHTIAIKVEPRIESEKFKVPD